MLSYADSFYMIYSCSVKSVLSDSLQHHGLYSPPGSSVHEIFPGKNTAVGCHFLLQGNFPDLGSNLCLLWKARDIYIYNDVIHSTSVLRGVDLASPMLSSRNKQTHMTNSLSLRSSLILLRGWPDVHRGQNRLGCFASTSPRVVRGCCCLLVP